MPELRLVVLALQDRLAYGPTIETAMAALFGDQPSTLSAAPGTSAPRAPAPDTSAPGTAAPGTPAPGTLAPGTLAPRGAVDPLIAAAAQDLAEYQRLTAEGKLGEAGQRLEALKQKLEQLSRQKR
jgi:uncharacterized protein